MTTTPNEARLARRALLALLTAVALVGAACSSDTTTATETDGGAASSTDDDGEAQSEDDHSDHDEMSGDDHAHGDALEVPDGMTVPSVAVDVQADPVSGVNVFVELDDFTIAPEHASTDAVDGEGHLHLYVDGERTMRFYNTALHLGNLTPGEHEITVEISANNHSAYAVDGEPIRATATITVDDDEATHHHSDVIDLDEAPQLDLEVIEDPKSGWNLHAMVDGFDFAPESASTDAVEGEGHLHLYVDGEKVTRLYGPWWHLDGLSEGSHTVEVELSANDHSAYGVDGEPIRAEATIEVSAEQATADSHDQDEAGDDEANEDGGHNHEGASAGDGITAADADVVIEASVTDGAVTVDEGRVEIEQGQKVAMVISSDEADDVHLHGYDVLQPVAPDAPATLGVIADVPGVFEVEMEGSGLLLFEIAVS